MGTQLPKKFLTCLPSWKASITIAIGMLFFSIANAQIIYTDVNPDQTYHCYSIGCNLDYLLDLNNDGIVDFKIHTGENECPEVDLISLNSNPVNTKKTKLNFNQVIDSNLAWASISSQNLEKYTSGGGFACDILKGSWDTSSDGYLGLKFKIGSQFFYGWARLSISLTGSVYFTIRDYAYNTIPDQPILAGQTDNFCEVPANTSATNITSASAKLKWDAVPGAEKYQLRYEIETTKDWITLYPVAHQKSIIDLSPNTEYTWQVKTVCHADSPSVVSPWSAKQHFTTASSRLIDNEPMQPAIRIYPNPVLDNATIQFTLPQPSKVSVMVCDVSGRKTETLMNDQLSAGTHSLQLNASKFSKGFYVVKMITDFGTANSKLIVQ